MIVRAFEQRGGGVLALRELNEELHEVLSFVLFERGQRENILNDHLVAFI